ncbi:MULTISPECIES: DotH/IcmK family type IV secretion protein [Asaia]|nr:MULTISPECIES: DotH/IcmK family type IV secretion protein [Asaia]ETC99442.1 hypothetical protein P792_03080 [Asaia sp. SF2.1]
MADVRTFHRLRSRSLALLAACSMSMVVPLTQAAEPDDDRHGPTGVYAGPPLTPGEITSLREHLDNKYDQTQQLLDDHGNPDRIGLPVHRTVTVSLTSGGAINILNLAQGFATAISFIDSTGEPWPIEYNANSNSSGGCRNGPTGQQNAGQAVMITGASSCIPAPGSNVLQIQPDSKYPRGNLIVTLKGAPKPLVFQWIAGPGAYDADLTFRIRERGPNAKADLSGVSDMPLTGTADLNSFGDGTPPAEAMPLDVRNISADDVQAWKYRGHYYLRTRYELQSPGPTSGFRLTGGAGWVYELPITPVLYLWVNQSPLKIDLAEGGS